jgi:hypothetical protein
VPRRRVPRPAPRTLALAAATTAAALVAVRPAVAAPASRGSCATPGAQGRVAGAVAFAERRYALEADGAAVHAALARAAADRVLVDAVAAGRLAAAGAEALRLVGSHLHITAVRVLRAGRVIVATTRYPFDVAGAQTTLRDRRGAVLGTLQLTIQDVVGFIRLVHEFTGAAVVVRGAAGEVRSSFAAGLGGGRLPASGCATLAGRAYAVRSFGERAFGGEPLTISVLGG